MCADLAAANLEGEPRFPAPQEQENPMSLVTHPARWLAGIAATAIVVIAAPAAPAAARPEDPPKPAVQRVEVPVKVPVDDARAEGIQMLVAAALGACAAGAAARRPRRGSLPPPGDTIPTVIDLTRTVEGR
jgi:hypothetical protein